MAFCVTKIERVDDHPNVGRIFARLPDVRDLDQLKSRFMQAALERLVAFEIAIRLLHHDVTFEKETLEHLAHIEGGELGVMRAERDIFQIEKNGHRSLDILCAHGSTV